MAQPFLLHLVLADEPKFDGQGGQTSQNVGV